MGPIDTIRNAVRSVMRVVARELNTVTGGKLSPNTVTIVGLLAHIPIAWLIAIRHPLWAALLLVIFGLMDTLDGELARLQNKASALGMLLDSTTDRMKEIMLYTAAAYNIIAVTGRPYLAVWAVAATGTALLVSYTNAWGEAVMARSGASQSKLNQTFRGGLASFEIRMFIFLLGLLTGRLTLALVVITVLAIFTVFGRLLRISRKLADV